MSRRYQDLVRQAKSSRIKYVLSALVDIRKNFIKNAKGVGSLVAHGLVQRLLELIKERSSLDDVYRSKVTDMTISILGNMCMEEVARKQLIKSNGVMIIADLLIDAETESLQTRSCRCLANVLLTPSSWELAHSNSEYNDPEATNTEQRPSVVQRITKLLQDTDNDECVQTYIRAIRLLGQTRDHVQKLVEHNSVGAVLKYVDCDTESVCQSALRCVHSLSIHGNSAQLASQVISSGKLPHLLSQAKIPNSDEFKLIIRLCDHYNFRPEFGNMGGISMFIEMFKSEVSSPCDWKGDILNVLCMCCKEAVNRVKLRDGGALVILLESLAHDSFTNLHARIISALVCFLYDQPSFDELLENRLVPILTKQLRRCFTDAPVAEPEESHIHDTNADTIIVDTENNKAETVVANSDAEKLTVECSIETNPSTENQKSQEQGKIKGESSQTNSEKEFPANDSTADKNTDKSTELQTIKVDNLGNDKVKIRRNSSCKQLYSIDSPSYESVSDWKEEQDSGGAKCIESFTPPPPVDWFSSKSYSPLSNTSYYSPSEGSPEYSSQETTNNSGYSPQLGSLDTSQFKLPGTSQDSCHGYSPETGSHSPPQPRTRQNHRHKYTGVNCRFYNTNNSPASSPERRIMGVENSSSSLQGTDACRRWSFSSDSEQETNALTPVSVIRTPGDSDCSPGYQYSPVTSPVMSESEGEPDLEFQSEITSAADTKIQNDKYSENGNQGSKGVIEDMEQCYLVGKNDKKRKKVQSVATVQENHILILLSRVSQMTDPTMHLVTKEVMECLLDYIGCVTAPLARAARLLSRILRNPLCFQKLLMLQSPIMIYQKLLEGEALPQKLLGSNRHSKTKMKIISPNLKHQHPESSPDSDRFSMTDESLMEEDIHPAKRQRKGSSSDQRQIHTLKGVYHKQEEEVCEAVHCGIAFLEDLSSVADTQYGRGMVERSLIMSSTSQQTTICLCLPFIVWSLASRHHFFTQKDILDRLLNPMTENIQTSSLTYEQAIVFKSLSFLAKVIDTKSKFQVKNLTSQAQQRSKTSRNSLKTVPKETKLADGIPSQKDKNEKNVLNCLKTSPCCVQSENHGSNDIVFNVQGHRIFGRRMVLIQNSEIFGAMLEGHYSEAKLSEINIPETSKFAFEYLIHYLHGCQNNLCAFMRSLYTSQVTKATAEQCIEIIMEADKFLLHSLQKEANDCLFSRYIVPESAFTILKYAALHGRHGYLKAAVSSILVDTECDRKMVEYVREIFESEFKDLFLTIVVELFTE